MTAQKSRIQIIEGLRGLAVLAVLIYHLDNLLLENGFLGVDVFFCISGFVVAYSLSTRSAEGFFEQTRNFYKRRAVRLIPALLVYLTLLRLFESLFIPTSWLSQNNEATAKSALFSVANIYLNQNTDGYFSERVDFNPFVHLWSLSTENQFYLVFPIIFWISNHLFRKKILLVMTALTAFLAIIAISYSMNPSASYYSPFSRFWQIFIGVIAYLIWDNQKNKAHYGFARNTIFSIGIVGLIVLFIKPLEDGNLFFLQSAATVMTFIILVSQPDRGIRYSRSLRFLLELRTIRYLGLISYSLYLWHWGIFVLFRWTIGLDSISKKAIAIFISVGVAHVSHKLIEERFSNYLNSRNHKKPVKQLIVTSLLVPVLLINVAPIKLGQISLSTSNDSQTWELNEKDKKDFPTINSNNYEKTRKLLIIGDSHAGAYSLLAKLSELDLGIETQIITLSGCPIFTFVGDSIDNPTCKDFLGNVTKIALENSNRGDIVFFASLRMPRLGNQWGQFNFNTVTSELNDIDKLRNRQTEIEVAVSSIRILNLAERIVLIDLPKPVFPSPAFRCLDWFNEINKICEGGLEVERAVLLDLAYPSSVAIREVMKTVKIETWDPFPVLCPTEVCSAETKNGSILYFDGDHLSNAGNQLLRASFTEKLNELWGVYRG